MDRERYISEITSNFTVASIVCLLGPRQSGKTTLARDLLARLSKRGETCHYLDLEDPTDLAKLTDAKLTLASLSGYLVIDEVQRRPDLFPVLRVLADRKNNPLRLLLLGSASRELIRQSSESLAGRIVFQEVTPFSLQEIASQSATELLWYRGGFPRSFLAESDEISFRWRQEYIRTYLEQDIPNLGLSIPANSIRRFWLMLSHYHGQNFNASEIASALGVSDTTVRRYLDILAGTFMVRQLKPWLESISKRQIKSPKIYLRDSGIYHALLDIRSGEALCLNPKIGASWEGFACEQLISRFAPDAESAFFWGVHGQAELDLFIIKNGRRLGFEIKHTSEPKVTASMLKAAEILKLDELTVVYRGTDNFPLSAQIRAAGLEDLITG